jgi:hypothetical protein
MEYEHVGYAGGMKSSPSFLEEGIKESKTPSDQTKALVPPIWFVVSLLL